jgi:hypothetical protein
MKACGSYCAAPLVLPGIFDRERKYGAEERDDVIRQY